MLNEKEKKIIKKLSARRIMCKIVKFTSDVDMGDGCVCVYRHS